MAMAKEGDASVMADGRRICEASFPLLVGEYGGGLADGEGRPSGRGRRPTEVFNFSHHDARLSKTAPKSLPRGAALKTCGSARDARTPHSRPLSLPLSLPYPSNHKPPSTWSLTNHKSLSQQYSPLCKWLVLHVGSRPRKRELRNHFPRALSEGPLHSPSLPGSL